MRAACADASRVRNPAKREANARKQTQQASNSEFDNSVLEDVPEANARHNLGLVEGESGTHASEDNQHAESKTISKTISFLEIIVC